MRARIEWHMEGLHLETVADPEADLETVARHIIELADQITPVLGGHDLAKQASYRERAEVTELRDSHYAEPLGDNEVQFGYDAPYAVYQHEKTWWHHAHGEPKWLENTINAETPVVLQEMADSVTEWLDEHHD